MDRVKLYVVNGCRFSMDEFHGVFSTREKAERYVLSEAFKMAPESTPDGYITEVTVDSLEP